MGKELLLGQRIATCSAIVCNRTMFSFSITLKTFESFNEIIQTPRKIWPVIATAKKKVKMIPSPQHSKLLGGGLQLSSAVGRGGFKQQDYNKLGRPFLFLCFVVLFLHISYESNS